MAGDPQLRVELGSLCLRADREVLGLSMGLFQHRRLDRRLEPLRTRPGSAAEELRRHGFLGGTVRRGLGEDCSSLKTASVA